jgi:hypothetical protein
MKLQYKIILVLIACLASFFAGRLTTKQKDTVKFVKGETIYRTIEVPKFIKSTIPTAVFLPVKKDTLFIDKEKIVIQTVDTAKIIENYIAERKYAFNVFDDENGKLDIDQTIQYNELQKFNYSFTPMQKVITQQKERVLIPFASASYNSFNIAGAGGGVFYKNVGIEYKYLYNVNNHGSGHEFGLKVKF